MAEEAGGKRLAAIAAVVIIILLVFGASLTSIGKYQLPKAGQAQGTIKVGCITFPENTPLGEASIEIKRGLELWAKHANEMGINVQGTTFKVELICQEAPADDAQLRSIVLNDLIINKKVDVIVAPPGDHYSQVILEMTENKGIPTILTYASDDNIFTPGATGPKKYGFMLMTPRSQIINNIFAMISKYNITSNNIAVIYEAVPGNELKSFANRIEGYLRSQKQNLVFKNPFSAENVTNVVGAMVTIKANPNILIILAQSTDALKNAITAVKEKQITTLQHIIVIAPTIALQDLEKSMPDKLNHVLYVSMWEPIAPISPFMAENLGIHWYGYTTSEKFVLDFYKEYGKMPTDLAALGYEAGLLIQYAYEKAGSLDHAIIADTILNKTYIMTFYGSIGFQGSELFGGGNRGLQAVHDPLIVEYVYTNGNLQKIIIWPMMFRTQSYIAP